MYCTQLPVSCIKPTKKFLLKGRANLKCTSVSYNVNMLSDLFPPFIYKSNMSVSLLNIFAPYLYVKGNNGSRKQCTTDAVAEEDRRDVWLSL